MSTYILSLLLSQVTGSAVGLAPPAPRVTDGRQEIPWCHDPRLVVERFASAPDIVHPIGIDFDARGRLLAIESHTHFRPQQYEGPKHDRVRVLEDTDGDGKVDRVKTFFEGTDFTMDLAVHPDGSVYLATRNEILRLRDSDGDGQADENQRIVFLDTKGNYPHNGLSGLAFDSKGDLYFGMGENLGAGYKLIGSDGTAIADEGEGGNVFWCTADGRKLRRVATGFWNPFGVCVDIFGRVFAVDNDPDASPPCRLVHIVEGGDYGYQFRYGRSGRHPFQCWNGQVPGTLPMVAGTGEAPCELVSYESDGLPAEYRGDLLVAAWADHRVERYVLKEKGASFTAEQKPFIQGGKNFHPAGIAVAPDGSLFVSDWVLSDYQLHGKGAIWHVRMKEAATPARPQDPRQALYSKHRPLREAAARALLAEGEAGRQFLRQQLGDPHYRTRAAALTALIDGVDRSVDLATLAERDPLPAIRAMAVRALAARGENATRFLNEKYPAAVRVEATGSLRNNAVESHLLPLLTDKDPFVRNAAVQSLAHYPGLLAGIKLRSLDDPLQRIGVLLAHRASGRPEATRRLAEFLADPDEEVRFLAIKWIADNKLSEFRPQVAKALTDHTLNVRMYLALSTAQARIDNQAVNEDQMAEFFLGRLADGQSPPTLRSVALQMVPATHKKLTVELVAQLLDQNDSTLQIEAVRALNEHPGAERLKVLLDVVRSSRFTEAVRAEAMLGLAEREGELHSELLELAQSDADAIRDEALRAMVGGRLSAQEREQLERLAARHTRSAVLVARVLGQTFFIDRPVTDDVNAWLKRLDSPADVAAGRRVFFHPKLAGCSRCHRVDGRGQDIGPDLSTIGRTERRHILESILQPNNLIAPHYQAWTIATRDGKTYTGMLVRTYLDEYTYVDSKGSLFKINTVDIEESKLQSTSIMPTGLSDMLTDQELRDLLEYLKWRR